MVPILSVIGFSKTGKTTFIGNLVRALYERGHRVAVIKHDPHDHGEVDREGSDTSVFWKAGSPAVVLSSPQRMTLFRRTGEDTPPESIVPLLGDVDCVLLEGYKGKSYPKVVIWSSKMKEFSLKQEELLAVIYNRGEEEGLQEWFYHEVPLFNRDEIMNFVTFLEKNYLAVNQQSKE